MVIGIGILAGDTSSAVLLGKTSPSQEAEEDLHLRLMEEEAKPWDEECLQRDMGVVSKMGTTHKYRGKIMKDQLRST